MKKLGIAFILSLTMCASINAQENYQIDEEMIKILEKNLNKEVELEKEIEYKNSIFVFNEKSITSVLLKGIEYLGIPYKFGGTNITGFDCSGFVQKVYKNSVGIFLPRTAKQMSNVGEKINKIEELNPGDLVFFNTRRFKFSHVGIYIGDNKFIHSPRRGETVKIEEIDQKYWIARFNGGRRLLNT